MKSLKSFIIQAAVLKLYRDLLKIKPNDPDWIAYIRLQFEISRNVDEDKAWYLCGDGQRQMNQFLKMK
ncbi:hypothetical protein pb186bvf_009016 [Paramecium bursaria]